MKTLAIIQVSMMFSGLILIWIAFSQRTENHPWYSNINPVFIWKRKSWYTPVGFVCHLAGFSLFYFGLLVGVFKYLV